MKKGFEQVSGETLFFRRGVILNFFIARCLRVITFFTGVLAFFLLLYKLVIGVMFTDHISEKDESSEQTHQQLLTINTVPFGQSGPLMYHLMVKIEH